MVFAAAVASLALAAPLPAWPAQRLAHHHMRQMMMMVHGRLAPVFAMVNGRMVPIMVEVTESANGS
jgi:hypothetical protein